MRNWTSLSAGILAIGFALPASAAPSQQITLSGRFPASGPSVEAKARTLVHTSLRNAASAELPLVRKIELSNGERIVRLRQEHRGIPVMHRGATVAFGKDGVARQIASKLEEDLPSDVTPSISKEKAAKAARDLTKLSVAKDATVLTIWPTADGNKLAWAVSPTPVLGIPYVPVVVVDAKSGEVLLHYNNVVHAGESNARMYPSNPVKSPELQDIFIDVEGDVLENDLIVAKNCIDNKSVKYINMMGFAIEAHLCDLEHKALRLPDGSFDYEPAADTAPEDEFAELSIFWHANRGYEFFREFDPNLELNGGKPLTTIANLMIPQGFGGPSGMDFNKIKDPDLPLQPFSNAFYAPSDPMFSAIFGIQGGALWFGQGHSVDFAYDGDVVYHELGHAVVNATLKLVHTPHMDEFGASMAPGAMNEGLADYFAAALTGDPDVGEYASQDIPGKDAIRTLDNEDKCPTAITGEVHGDASLFSGGLWDVRKTLDEDDAYAFDRAIFTAMNSSATGDVSYEDVANLIIEAVKAEGSLGEATAQALSEAFTKHGVFPRCDRIIDHPGDGPLRGSPEMGGTWAALGTQTTGARAQGEGWTPGIVQFRHELPENAAKLFVDFREVNMGGGGGGSPFGGGGTPFKPKLLVRFDEPVTFTYKPLAGAEDMLAVDLEKEGSNYSTTVDIPVGATVAYVMIGSTGQSDGAYTSVDLKVETAEPVPEPEPEPEQPGDGEPGLDPVEDAESSGCGCEVPGAGSTTSKTGALAALSALALALVRRRKAS